jgi:hypothetical protein
MTGLPLLAQSTSMSLQQGIEILKGLGWLAAAVVVLIIVSFFFRRWLVKDVGAGSSQFTMQQLRDLHKEGMISDEEYDRARKHLVAMGRRVLHENEPPRDNDEGKS